MGTTYILDAGFIASLPGQVNNFANATSGDQTDQWGNTWFAAGNRGNNNGHIQVFSPTGAVLQTYLYDTLVAAMCSYASANGGGTRGFTSAGSTIEDTGHAIHVVNLGGVSYLLFHVTKYNGGAYWHTTIGVFQLGTGGAYTVVGMNFSYYWTAGPPGWTTSCVKLDLANFKTINDPIIVVLATTSGGNTPLIKFAPSISATLGNALAVNTYSYQYPGASSVSTDPYYNFGLSQILGINAIADQPVFAMPSTTGTGTNLCIYIATNTMANTSNTFLTGTIKPTYPNGCMLQVPLGAPSFVTATSAPSSLGTVNLAAPVPVPGCFISNTGVAYNYFADSGLWINGTTGAAAYAEYFATPRIIAQNGNGWTVAWYQPWFGDPSYQGAWTFHERLRVQRYDWAAGTFTDLVEVSGGTATAAQIGGAQTQVFNYYDIQGWAIIINPGFIGVWHYDGPSAQGSGYETAWASMVMSAITSRPTSQGYIF